MLNETEKEFQISGIKEHITRNSAINQLITGKKEMIRKENLAFSKIEIIKLQDAFTNYLRCYHALKCYRIVDNSYTNIEEE